MKVYIDLYCSVTDDQERFTDDDMSSIEIEIDEQCNWDMPSDYASCGLVARRIENYMEWWIANRFDANDFAGCPDEYYDSLTTNQP
jgi:hypothetical protein